MRFCASICRHLAVCHAIALKLCTVIVIEGDEVFIHYAIKVGSIDSISSNGNDFRFPTFEVICILSSCKFLWSCTVVSRHCSIVEFAGLEFCAIVVNERDGVLINHAVKLSGINSITGYGYNFRLPTFEGVGVLSGCKLLWCCAIVFRHCTVVEFAGLKFCSIVVVEGYCILVNDAVVGCRINIITRNSPNLRHPAFEDIGILRRSGFCRCLAIIRRNCAFFPLVKVQFFTIPVLKCYIVHFHILSGVGGITDCFLYFRIPIPKDIPTLIFGCPLRYCPCIVGHISPLLLYCL